MFRLITLVLALMLGACASGPHPLRSDATELPSLALPPGALPMPMALQQRLTFTHAGGEQSIDALLEIDEHELRLVLHSLGQPLMRVRFDGVVIESSQADGMPAQLSAERVLNDLQLVYWPTSAIAAAFPAGWTLHEQGPVRSLRQHGDEVLSIRREAMDDEIVIEHHRAGYRLRIQSQAVLP